MARGRIPFFGLLLALMIAAGRLSAGEIWLFQGEPPTAEEMATILFPEASKTTAKSQEDFKLKFRGIQFQEPPGRSQSAAVAGQAQTPQSDVVGYNVQFEFNSADLKSEARVFLDRVAEMLRMERTAQGKLLVEGHTDAVGSDLYNLGLSARRSEAVKRYLVENQKLDPSRLVAVAKGKSELLDRSDPASPTNRRVQFRSVN